MGISIDLHSYDLKKLIKLLMSKGVTDEEKLRKILLDFGSVVGNRYILLNNEYYEDANCFYLLSQVIDAIFGKQVDSFDAFCGEREKTGYEEMVSYMSPDDIDEKYGLELNDDGEWIKPQEEK